MIYFLVKFLWKALEKKEVEIAYIQMIKDMYEGTMNCNYKGAYGSFWSLSKF